MTLSASGVPAASHQWHRSASEVFAAQRLGSDHAAMIVHSFASSRTWFANFKSSVALCGATIDHDELAHVEAPGRNGLYLGWAAGSILR